MAVITYGGNTDTKSHNKRNRHRARRHTSGIEGHRQKALWNKQRKEECQYAKCNQHVGQRYAEQHAQKCNDEKYAHSQRDRKISVLFGMDGTCSANTWRSGSEIVMMNPSTNPSITMMLSFYSS